jgi:hypothetical protein
MSSSMSIFRKGRRRLLRHGDETFEADPGTEKMLLDSIAQCDRGETIPLSQLLASAPEKYL